jgi:hypothetical protein
MDFYNKTVIFRVRVMVFNATFNSHKVNCNDTEIPWCVSATIQRFLDVSVQWYKDSLMCQCNDTEIPWCVRMSQYLHSRVFCNDTEIPWCVRMSQ